MNSEQQQASIKIGLRAFLGAALIILLLMIGSGIMTRVLPSGRYDRNNVDGRSVLVPGSFHYTEKPVYPVWRWFTAPAEVVTGKDNLTVITIIFFIIFMSGSFTIMEKAGIVAFLLNGLIKRFQKNKYLLMAIIIFLFMFMAAFLGVYEGLVPLIVFIVPLAYSLGWDSLTGLGMSLLALSFGFSAAVTNPFTIAVAQKIAELPLFSGAWLRIIFFVIIYAIVYFFVSSHAKKVEKDPQSSIVYKLDKPLRDRLEALEEFKASENDKTAMRKALVWFSSCLFLALGFVVVSSFIPGVSDYAFPMMGLLFLIGGVGSGFFAGLNTKKIARIFASGTLNILPGIILILMAYSVKYIIDQGQITDTILYSASQKIAGASAVEAVFLIYGLTLFMNFFIGSASAKAFLMMPILAPLSDLVHITRQTAVLAFDFGDGFSNMIYPSNALLLIALGFTVVSYPKWIRWTLKLQAVMLVITSIFLVIAVRIGFGPF